MDTENVTERPFSPTEAIPTESKLEKRESTLESAAESPESAMAESEKIGQEGARRLKEASDIIDLDELAKKFPTAAAELRASVEEAKKELGEVALKAKSAISEVTRSEVPAPVPQEAVTIRPMIQVGEISPKVAKRMTREDLAAVTARKEIPIGGNLAVDVSPEGVTGKVVDFEAQEATPDQIREVGAALSDAEEQEVRVEKAMESGDVRNAHEVLNKTVQEIDAQIMERAEELKALYAKEDRTPEDDARIEKLEFANGFDRKRKELRKTEIEYTLLKQKQERHAEAFHKKQDEYEAEADPEKKQKLQEELAAMGQESEDLETQLLRAGDRMTDLRGAMKSLENLYGGGVSDTEAPKPPEAKTPEKKTVPTSKRALDFFDEYEPSYGSGYGRYGEGSGAAKPKAEKPSFFEKLIDYAAYPVDRWFDMAFDPQGSSQRTINFLNAWAKKIGEAEKESK